MRQFMKLKYQEIVVPLQRETRTTNDYEYQEYYHSRIDIAHLDSMQRGRKTGESYEQGW